MQYLNSRNRRILLVILLLGLIPTSFSLAKSKQIKPLPKNPPKLNVKKTVSSVPPKITQLPLPKNDNSVLKNTVTGQVINEATKKPMPGVTVVTAYAAGNGFTDIADVNGKFSLHFGGEFGSYQIYVAGTPEFGSETLKVHGGDNITLIVHQSDSTKIVNPNVTYVPSAEPGIRIAMVDEKTGKRIASAPLAFYHGGYSGCRNPSNEQGYIECPLWVGVYRVYFPPSYKNSAHSEIYQFSVAPGHQTQFNLVVQQ